MSPGRSGEPSRELLRCADVLGAFGVTAAEVRAFAARAGSTPGRDDSSAERADSLETVLAALLADADDRTALVRRLICRSDRGFSCPARYDHDALEEALAGVFESVDWLFELLETRDGLLLTAADPVRRRRERTMSYPATPLGTNNLPAVLYAINEAILRGTDARILLLSTEADRWRAALIREDDLDRLQRRYGRHIGVFDRPLRPADDLAAYVPDASADADEVSTDGPWPAWAHDGAGAGAGPGQSASESGDGNGATGVPAAEDAGARDDGARTGSDGGEATVDANAVERLIEEAEPDGPDRIDAGRATAERGRSGDASESHPDDADDGRSAAQETTVDATRSIDGFELSGSSAVSRVPGAAGDRDEASEDGTDGRESARETDVSTADSRTTTTDGWSLSGTTTTARVSNDAFGTDDVPQSEDDRYRALGAALTTGRDVSVKGLLEDDEFLPSLPAAEPEETRLTFEDSFDPDAVEEAKAVAEESGFVWVESGSMETTRISNG
ncbi:hypothetical protein ACFO5R_01235 [Halosolutus amylolyticus]|uniref:Uncharacterized protein n=1 Tax=Halosolutus amylolyticus TaxID=2932267 RepID=A0ABD5PIZ2_9EURY|nr:hypothetical protein [Halosolutus amylolyticus]